MGRIITATENDCSAVVANLRTSRKKWAWILIIMVQEVGYEWTSGLFYKASYRFWRLILTYFGKEKDEFLAMVVRTLFNKNILNQF